MFRLLVVPVIIGILAFLSVYFVAPMIVAESNIISTVAEFALNLSNSYFATMPPIMASYIANLNLLIVASTAALLLVVVTQLVVAIGGTLISTLKWIVSLLQKDRAEEVVEDLAPIDIDSKYMRTTPGKEILGRGIDSIERN